LQFGGCLLLLPPGVKQS